jgi:hypothetical protein
LRKWIFSCLENSSLIRKLIALVQVYHIKHTLWWIDNSSQSQIIIILLPFWKKEISNERKKKHKDTFWNWTFLGSLRSFLTGSAF